MTPQVGHLCQHQHYICRIVKADPAGFRSWYLTTRATDGTIIAGPDSEFIPLSANVIPFPGRHLPASVPSVSPRLAASRMPPSVPTHPAEGGALSNYGDV
jgi:hypothetical protein